MKNDLKIFTDNIQPEATNQIYNLISQVPFEDSVVRIMPDVHCGMECVVGFTSTFTDKLIPNVIGVDIGCGMLTINLGNVDIDLARLDEFIKKTVVVGSTTKKKYNIDPLVNKLLCKNKLKDCSSLSNICYIRWWKSLYRSRYRQRQQQILNNTQWL